MKVTEHISQAKSTLVSFEILPPLKGKTIQSIYNHLDALMEFKPSFINVTYHRIETMFKKKADSTFEKVEVRKRPGTVAICAAIKNHYNIDTVPHLICGGFSKRDTEDALIDLNFLGIDNVLVLRGDAAKNEANFEPEPNGHTYAVDLLKQIVNLKNGIYQEEDIKNGGKPDFCIGTAGYPEKHFEAPNMISDIKYLKAKVDAGAEYIVTQMFFDNKKFFDFVALCKANDINVPIIPGLKILSSKKQITALPKIFHIDIPQPFYEQLEKCKDDKQIKEIGIKWCIEQSKELVKANVPCLHFYTMGSNEATKAVANAVF